MDLQSKGLNVLEPKSKNGLGSSIKGLWVGAIVRTEWAQVAGREQLSSPEGSAGSTSTDNIAPKLEKSEHVTLDFNATPAQTG